MRYSHRLITSNPLIKFIFLRNMFHCYGCKLELPTPSELIKHMRLSCNKLLGCNDFRCGETGCIRYFSTSSGLRQHLHRSHTPKQVTSLIDNPHNEIPQFVSNHSENILPSTSQPSHSCVSPLTSSTQSKGVEKQLAIFLSSIYSKTNVPRNIVQIVSKEVTNLICLCKDTILYRLQCQLDENNIEIDSDLKRVIENLLEEFSSSMSQFKSEYRRFQFFENLGTLIQPTELQIGQRIEVSRGPDSNVVSVPATMQVISVADVLKQLLLLPGVMRDTLQNMENFKDLSNGIENIMQGSVWLKMLKKLKNDDDGLNLPLILFFDDFEVGNPLGSHSGIHKLGGVYISLPFLPIHYVSQLNNILMIGLFHSSDRVTFGNNMVFQKVFDQLNNLKNKGLYIETDSYKGSIKFHVTCLTGDNLGLNSLLGFVESFVANRYCRICFANKEQMKVMLYEDKELLRNLDNYENDLNVHNSSQTGIKERCVFLDNLTSFDMFEQVAVDLLHDFLEGTCRYVITYVVKFLVIESKLIPLSTLQSKIKCFDYGPDSSAKPLNCIVVDGSTVTIRTSAAEMITLVRYLGLIAGYYVPDKCEPWELYLYLRRILDRLLNPRVSEEGSEQLKFWVAGLNELFCKLTQSHLRPKFHFMIHYPSMLLKFGPLTQVWTMRFEAKHRLSKIAARTSCNKVNICKTIALKNQLVLNHVFLQNKPFVNMTCGKKTLTSHRIPENELESFGLNEKDQYTVKWVMLTGHKIGISSILTIDLCTETYQPLSGKVLKIYVIKSEILFYVSLFETVGLNTHFFAYKVNTGVKFKYIISNSLLSVVPNTITIMRDSNLYITLRMPID